MIGYRIWVVRTTEDERPRHDLTGITMTSYAWRPGVNVADCLGSANLPHPDVIAPAEGCHCGFWMLDDIDKADWKFQNYLRSGGRPLLYYPGCPAIASAFHYAFGVVEAWGRVIVHEDGKRCQKMRVLALLDSEKISDRLTVISRAQDVPLFKDRGELQQYAESF